MSGSAYPATTGAKPAVSAVWRGVTDQQPMMRGERIVDTNSYVAFLLIGTLLVVVDGQVIYRNGRRYLQQATRSHGTDSLTRLVTVLFHLGVLGVLALISTIDIPADTELEGVVLRLGIVLLVIAIAHWIAIAALSQVREREEYEELTAERSARRQAHEAAMAAGSHVTDPTVTPAYTGESATETLNRPQRY
jgi:hypothetical protein